MITGKALGEKYIVNGKTADVSGFIPDMSADIYYEVVRMIDGKFLFLPDHLNRLKNSLLGTGLQFPGSESITTNLKLLKENNPFSEGNIRICLQKTGENTLNNLCYFVPYFYPEIYMYKSGVKLVTYPHVRPNPGIKKWDNRFRVSVNEYIREYGVYEALLMNESQHITEGSRSNVFFIDQNNNLITTPEKDILPGITRKYVLNICRENGIHVVDRPVQLGELSSLVSCFISGTSPKVLPVWQVDGIQFRVDHPVLQLLMEEFDTLIDTNLTDLSGLDASH